MSKPSPLLKNIIALYGIQIFRYILPLVSLPYLARTLGPSVYSLVIYSQAYSAWITLVVEYGFNLSATRKVARNKESRTDLAEIASEVFGAKLILLTVSGIVTIVFIKLSSDFDNNSIFFILSWIAASVLGFSPIWYFQGLEKLQLPALIDIVAQMTYLLLLILFVNDASDGWKVLGAQVVVNVSSLAILKIMLYRNLSFKMPNFKRSAFVLKEGLSMFFFRGFASLYTSANAIILGIMVPVEAVGLYSIGEKLTKTVLSLINPISQSLYPRVSSVIDDDPITASMLVRRSMYVLVSIATMGSVILFVCAPFIVDVLLGRDYTQVVYIIRVLVILLPIVAVSNVLGIQWMLPLKKDRYVNTIIVLGGVLNITQAFFVVPSYGVQGMAWCVVVSELFVALSMIVTLRLTGIDPFHSKYSRIKDVAA